MVLSSDAEPCSTRRHVGQASHVDAAECCRTDHNSRLQASNKCLFPPLGGTHKSGSSPYSTAKCLQYALNSAYLPYGVADISGSHLLWYAIYPVKQVQRPEDALTLEATKCEMNLHLRLRV